MAKTSQQRFDTENLDEHLLANKEKIHKEK